MAQGVIKSKPKVVAKSNPAKTKKGARVAKSKKATSADKMQKKFAAGIVAKTERLLGERAGHLEMIGKGRDRSGKAAADGKKSTAGGSKKFG